jgi:hypothetical protein
MINNLSVLSSPAANSADFRVTTKGKLNVTGLPQINVGSITGIDVIPASAEQIKKLQVTLTAQNSAAYIATISGYAMSNGNSVDKTISFTSAASASLTSVSLQMITAINSLSDFNVSATNAAGGVTGDASGIVILTAKTATTSCINAPTFSFLESDAKIALTADATATAAAAPTGGVTAVLEPVINASGVMTGIRIIDGGAGYLAAPAITIANGGGAGTTPPSATCAIFEGSVVAITFTAGTAYTYTTYKGFLVVGTGLAIKQKYGFVSPAIQRAVPLSYKALENLVDTSSYTEIVISYNEAQVSGTTNSVSTVATLQASLCVLEGSTNSADILSLAYGSVANLRKGYRSSFEAAVALDGTTAVTTTTFVIATGVLTLSAAISNGLKANDIILAGTTPAIPNTADTNAIAKVLSFTTVLTGVLVQIGGGNLVAAITTQTLATRVVRRDAIVG